jgi:inward rectifier potassium channel
VVHPIDELSPFHKMKEGDLGGQDAIIGVSLVGIDEVFSQTVYARHTFGPADIRWGHDFKPILGRGAQGQRLIDYTHFHDTEPEEVEENSAPVSAAT